MAGKQYCSEAFSYAVNPEFRAAGDTNYSCIRTAMSALNILWKGSASGYKLVRPRSLKEWCRHTRLDWTV